MSFAPNPSQASATGTTSSSNVAGSKTTTVSTAASGGIAAGSGGDSNDDSLLKNRTFDVTWVEKKCTDVQRRLCQDI